MYALSGRVDTLEEDVTRLKGYEETTVKHFVFDIATAAEQTLEAVLENSEVVEWFRKANNVPAVWSHFTITGIGNTALDGTYGRNFKTKKYSDALSYKEFSISTAGKVMLNKLHTLKADTTTGAISYDETSIDITGSYTRIYINFYKGEVV